MSNRHLTWRRVFNTDLRIPMWGHIDRAIAGAVAAGYEFFCWNGCVYHVTVKSLDDVVCLVDEVE